MQKLPESNPLLSTTWSEWSDEQRNSLVARVLLRGEMPQDVAISPYCSQSFLGTTLDLFFTYARDYFPAHKETFGDKMHWLIGTTLRSSRYGEGSQHLALEISYLRAEIFLENLRASDVCYAFCSTYGPLFGIEVPEYK